jgi:hypothetical protein
VKIQINDREKFVKDFLTPLSKLNESVVLKITNDSIYSLTSSSDGTLILYAVYNQKNETTAEGSIKLNIPDINKLVKVLSCINDSDIVLDLDDNSINYKSTDMGFKFHLLEDGIISSPSISIDKIKKLEFDSEFVLPYNNVISVLKGSTFTTETDKIYFYTNSGAVYGKLTDLDRHNVDVYTQKISDEFKGTALSEALPLNFETIRIICSLRFKNLNVSVNTDMKVFIFDVINEDVKLNFISSAYVS